MNLGVIFLTGLTVGGLTCLAVQGGLLASVIAAREEDTSSNIKRHALYSTGVFLAAKFFSYTILGAILGAFGGALNISGEVQTWMQLFAGVYMILVALNLLNIHPIFRFVIIQPPRFLTRLVRNQSKSKDIFAPALLGAMTIFIPCGTTLAMEALAISTTSAIIGASVMAAFILGTMPLFIGIGALTSVMGEAYKARFFKLAAVVVIYLGVTSINGALVSMDSPFTFQNLAEKFPVSISIGGPIDEGERQPQASQSSQLATSQDVEIGITSAGYTPDYFRVRKGERVKITLKSVDAYSCASAFRIPSLGIRKNLTANDTQEFTFTPNQTGKIQFNCSMGMYRGVIEVI